MITVKFWQSDARQIPIPEHILQTTKFSKDGWPDGRYRKQNAAFWAWLKEIDG